MLLYDGYSLKKTKLLKCDGAGEHNIEDLFHNLLLECQLVSRKKEIYLSSSFFLLL